jgi:hypothetical protein
VKGCPKEIRSRITVYNYADVKKAIADGELIFWVEGEKAVEELRKIGVTATTTLGGSGGLSNYGVYRRDLDGSRLVLCPDRDLKGIQYMNEVAAMFPNNIDRYYLGGTLALWKHPEGGMDVADEILSGNVRDLEGIMKATYSMEDYRQIGGDIQGDIDIDAELDAELLEEFSQKVRETIDFKGNLVPPLFDGLAGEVCQELSAIYDQPRHVFEFLLLPVFGSLINANTRLVLDPSTGYLVPPTRWCALVGKTGTHKSPLIERVTKPIKELQAEAWRLYKDNKESYETDYKRWKNTKSKDKGGEPQLPDRLKNYYFDDTTIEAIGDASQYHPTKGSLVLNDELASFFNSMDAYRSKKKDRQTWLTIWNGGGIKVNRVCLLKSLKKLSSRLLIGRGGS